jgi:hypothetical protein
MTNEEKLKGVVAIINEADKGLKNKTRTIDDSAIPEELSTALLVKDSIEVRDSDGKSNGMAVKIIVIIIFAIVASVILGSEGFVLAILAAIVLLIMDAKNKAHLNKEKERLLKEVEERHLAVIDALNNEVDASKERRDYLSALNNILKQKRKDLTADWQ